jgi:hypothetical protein
LEPGPKRKRLFRPHLDLVLPASSTPPARGSYFFLPLVVLFFEDFEDDFLAVLFLVAMALVPPFSVAQSKER